MNLHGSLICLALEIATPGQGSIFPQTKSSQLCDGTYHTYDITRQDLRLGRHMTAPLPAAICRDVTWLHWCGNPPEQPAKGMGQYLYSC